MGRFCFICGKKTDKLIDGMCEDCYIKRLKLADVPRKINIIKCPKCGRIRIGFKWYRESEDVLRKVIKKNINLREKVDRIDIDRINSLFEVVLYKKVIERTKIERHVVRLHYDKRICELCAKKESGYYRARLQLRGEVNDNVLKFVEKKLNGIDRVFFTVKRVKGGYDFLINSKSAVKKLEKSMGRKYNIEIKRGYKLVTRKLGRNIYRDVVSIRIKDIYR